VLEALLAALGFDDEPCGSKFLIRPPLFCLLYFQIFILIDLFQFTVTVRNLAIFE
jgi:hypothetical protein